MQPMLSPTGAMKIMKNDVLHLHLHHLQLEKKKVDELIDTAI
jgi:hypothetical protein